MFETKKIITWKEKKIVVRFEKSTRTQIETITKEKKRRNADRSKFI